MQLIERNSIKKIMKFVGSPDIIVLHGSRQVGKTSILKYLQNDLTLKKKNTYYIDLEDSRMLNIFNEGVDAVMNFFKERTILNNNKLYLFIDEIQYLNDPSGFLKLIHDHHNDKLKIFVSGSSSFEIKSKFKDSLVGRTLNFEIYPLSFEEFLLFKNYKINLSQKELSNKTIEELKNLYKEFIFYGGYPRIVLENVIYNKEIYLQQIIDTYIRKDIRDLANIKDIEKFNKLLEVLASGSGQLLNVLELSNTIKLSRQTIEHYLFLMENTYIIKLLKPYSKNLRNELFKTPKIFFYDTGIAHLLWLKSFPKIILGNMFETSVFGEFVKNRNKEEIFFWRTQDKKEIDFIIRKGHNPIPVEAKLSQTNMDYTPINYFSSKYKLNEAYFISFNRTESKTKKDIKCCYPWEISKEIIED